MIDDLISYLEQFIGRSYAWGGDDPLSGFDCSGYVSEGMRSVGMIGNKERLTAQQLYNRFEHNGTHGVFSKGALAFYGKDLTRITHVAIMRSDLLILEAGGGDSSTITEGVASQKNAFIRMRPVKYRNDFLITVKPRYPGSL